MIDRFRKGRRIITHWDKKSEQVTILSKKKNKNKSDGIEILQDSIQEKTSNIFIVQHSQDEFIFDFGQDIIENKPIKIHTRIIMSPQQAKRFLLNIKKHINNISK